MSWADISPGLSERVKYGHGYKIVMMKKYEKEYRLVDYNNTSIWMVPPGMIFIDDHTLYFCVL